MNRVSPVGGLAQVAEQVARWIREADRVVIGAGSGLSVAAGLDFGDEADFAARFPSLVRRGLKAAYQMIGYSGLSETAFWGFWSVHVMQMRFAEGRSPVYESLLRLVREKDCFVLTTNVDALFVRNGFEPERVWSIQGDYAFLQCLRACTTEVWPSAPPLQRALAAIDPVTQEVADPACVPRCIHCGGNVFLNVRGGDWFLEEPYRAQVQRWRHWFGGIPSRERLRRARGARRDRGGRRGRRPARRRWHSQSPPADRRIEGKPARRVGGPAGSGAASSARAGRSHGEVLKP